MSYERLDGAGLTLPYHPLLNPHDQSHSNENLNVNQSPVHHPPTHPILLTRILDQIIVVIVVAKVTVSVVASAEHVVTTNMILSTLPLPSPSPPVPRNKLRSHRPEMRKCRSFPSLPRNIQTPILLLPVGETGTEIEKREKMVVEEDALRLPADAILEMATLDFRKVIKAKIWNEKKLRQKRSDAGKRTLRRPDWVVRLLVY